MNARNRALATIASTAMMGGMLAGGVASPALATGEGVVVKVTTSGLMLNVRAGTSTDTPRKRMLLNGTRITVVCQDVGENISGKVRTTNLWDKLLDGTYVSDAYITRSGAIPRCVPGGQVQPPITHTPNPSTSGWVAPIPGRVGSGFRTVSRPSHDGVDIAAKKETPILATAAGTVITAVCNASTGNCDVDGSPSIGGCGWYVELQHAGRVVTRYCHMVRKPSVKVGQDVKPGQVIGYVGSSGNSSGPHLHFEVHIKAAPAHSANAVEPTAFLRTKGVVIGAPAAEMKRATPTEKITKKKTTKTTKKTKNTTKTKKIKSKKTTK